MNKKVLFASIVALSGIFATASAQTPQQSCCTDGQNCPVEQQNKGGKSKVSAFNPFEGLNLTAQQQAQLDQLKQEKQAAREAAKKDKADRKTADREQAKTTRAAELAKIKAILTPEQYVTFLENNFLAKSDKRAQAGRPDGKMARADKRFGKSDFKGQKDKMKGEKGQKDDKGQKSEQSKK